MPTTAQTLLNITRVAERAVEWIDAIRNRPSEATTAARLLEHALNPQGIDRRDSDKATGRCAIIAPGDWPESVPAMFGAIRRLKDQLDLGGNAFEIAAAMEVDAVSLLEVCRGLYGGEKLTPAFHRELTDQRRTLRLSQIANGVVRHAVLSHAD